MAAISAVAPYKCARKGRDFLGRHKAEIAIYDSFHTRDILHTCERRQIQQNQPKEVTERAIMSDKE